MVHDTHLYDILSVPSTATLEEIRRSYKRLALKYHPDKTNRDPILTEKFKEITRAYEILSDSSQRQAYDIYGEDGHDESAPERQESTPESTQEPTQESTQGSTQGTTQGFTEGSNQQGGYQQGGYQQAGYQQDSYQQEPIPSGHFPPAPAGYFPQYPPQGGHFPQHSPQGVYYQQHHSSSSTDSCLISLLGALSLCFTLGAIS